ncbi:MAG: DUF1330 domain-containing protein [Alphaproteobacteria bacterium]|nr:DUF1330 domain-containing protein [Alphaproteobacteria bacterium]
MPKGYWIVAVDVTDAERYPAYQAKVGEAFSAYKYAPRFLVRGGRCEIVEGESRPRRVVVEFDSYDDAVECYYGDAYQAAANLRRQFGATDFVIVEGI